MRRDPRNVCVSQPDDTAIRGIEAAHEVEHRALPGSIRSDDARDLARVRIEAEVVYRADATEVHRQVACTTPASAAGSKERPPPPPWSRRSPGLPLFDRFGSKPDEAAGPQPQHQ